MRFSFQKTVLAVSLVTLSNAVIAASEPEQTIEPQGVLLDISQVDPKNDSKPVKSEPSLDNSSAEVLPKPVAAEASAPAAVEPVVIETSSEETVVEEQPVPAAPAETGTVLKVIKTPTKTTADSTPKTNRGAEVLGAITTAMRPGDTVSPLSNNRFSFYLGENVAYAQYESSAERFKLENARTHLGFLYSEERDTIFQGGLALDAAFAKSFRLSFGARAYAALLSRENEDAFSAALGAETAYRLPFQALPLEFGASIYYAPDILTFGTADRTLDAQVDLTLPVRSQLSVFAGYRFLQVDARQNDREVDNRIHLGVRWDLK